MLVAGAAFNVLFAFLLACVLWLAGRPELENVTTTRIGYVVPTVRLADGRDVPSPALAGGLRVNDVIRAVDGRTVSDWPDIQEALVLGTGSAPDGQRVARLTIERGAAVLDVIVHPMRLGEEQMRRIGISPAHEVIVDKVDPGSRAGTWGLQAGDRFQSIDGIPVTGVEALSDYLAQHPRKSFTLVVLRDGRSMPLVAPDRASASANVFSGVEFTTNYRLLYQNPYSICSQIMATTFRTLWSLILPAGRCDALPTSAAPSASGSDSGTPHSRITRSVLRIWFAVLLNLNLAILQPAADSGAGRRTHALCHRRTPPEPRAAGELHHDGARRVHGAAALADACTSATLMSGGWCAMPGLIGRKPRRPRRRPLQPAAP